MTMKDTHHPRRIGRSIGALLTGILAGVILSLGTNELPHVAGIFPVWDQPMSDALFLPATVYRTVYNLGGVTSWRGWRRIGPAARSGERRRGS
jgi:hypothetical protein